MVKCEYYARATAKHPTDETLEATVGVEYAEGDDVDEMTHEVLDIASAALARGGGNHVRVVQLAEVQIKYKYPGRAFFVETDEICSMVRKGSHGVQVYQPFGMPRELCAACGGKLCR